MIRIDRVKIENFQSHVNTELTFSEGLNVIVGPSDQGKSAIIRAIKWVLYNEPRGTDFIRQGTNSVRVSLELSNGFTITRERTPSKNRYILTDPEDNTNIYEGFGNEIPYEVIKAHGIPKIVLDTDISSSLNIGEQLEGPFLLSESGATRAKAIGRLTGLHIIDKSIRDSVTDLRRENQTRDRISAEINDIDEKLVEYKNIKELGRKLEDAQRAIVRIESLLDRVNKVEDIKQQKDGVENEHVRVNGTLSRLSGLNELEIYLKSAEISVSKLNSAQNMNRKYSDIVGRISDMVQVLKETDNVNEGIELLKVIYERSARHDKLKKAVHELTNIKQELQKVQDILHKTHDIQSLDLTIKKISELGTKQLRTASVAERLNSLDREIIIINKYISSYENAQDAQSIVESVGEKLELLKKLEVLRGENKVNINNINEGIKFLDSNKRDLEKLLKDYTTLLREKGNCPLCGSSIGDEKLENIIRHYEEVH